jgi:hypothetical protein
MIDDVMQQNLQRWALLQKEIRALAEAMAPIVEEEKMLRALIVSVAFPKETEGTHDIDLANGWKLKAALKLDRKVDEAALPAVVAQLQKMQVNADVLLRVKHEVEVKQYRQLTEEQRKVFDQMLTIKPQTPTLELVPPKEAK